jgi:hypothetical protein
MEVKMDMSSMPMPDMHFHHNTFWRQNQVTVTFYSDIPLTDENGVNNGELILRTLDLETQLSNLNQFLKEQQINYTLSFFQEAVKPQPPDAGQDSLSNVEQPAGSFKPPAGVHLFGLNKPIRFFQAEIKTSVITFFNFSSDTSSSSMTGPASEPDAHAGMDMGGNGDSGHSPIAGGAPSPVAAIVNGLNEGLGTLNTRKVPIAAASPNLLCGGAGSFTQGCPLTPSIPLEDNCALWHFCFPGLDPDDLQDMTGDGVTVFILDALPEREVIEKAAQKAGDDNLLLVDVNDNVTFNYDLQLTPIISPEGPPVSVGKDVYGEHFAAVIPDHGLFVAGIVHDLAPDATIECIRVLNEYCVGDLDVLTRALEYIHNRMSPGNDLDQQPVVINLSLVIPTQEELQSRHVNFDASALPYTGLLQQIQSLTELGAVIAASAGNEGDQRGMPSSTRPGALPPAAFANPPYSIEGIIPVGAVDSTGTATYSCYPGRRGIATYGGKIPSVTPPQPDPHVPPTVTVDDAVRGIYSSRDYPPLLATDPPYPAPDDHGWAYWVGTSFATPVISALTARILDWKSQGGPVGNVHDAVIAAAGAHTATWDRLDPATTGTSSTNGPRLLAKQECLIVDKDERKKSRITS